MNNLFGVLRSTEIGNIENERCTHYVVAATKEEAVEKIKSRLTSAPNIVHIILKCELIATSDGAITIRTYKF